MTDLLHIVPAPPTPPPDATATSAAPAAPSVLKENVAPLAGPSTRRRASRPRTAQRRRGSRIVASLIANSTIVKVPPSPAELDALSTRQLHIIVNQAYRLMDTDDPPGGAMELYETIVGELERRTHLATERPFVQEPKGAFRDNPVDCRFELFVGGALAVYVKYRMNGGQLILLEGVEQPRYRDEGLDATLMRHVVLNAHKRRLSLVAHCSMAYFFLAENPQYQALTGPSAR